MFPEITSTNYNKCIGEFVIHCKVWVDENNKWWYAYEDIVEFVEIPEQKANKIFKHEIPEEEKYSCYDNNNYNSVNNQQRLIRDFISSEMVRQIIRRDNQRNNALIKFVNNVECDGNAHTIFEDDTELNIRLNLLSKSIEESDYEEIFYQSYMLSKSNSGKDTLDKLGIIDKKKEEIVELMLEDIYEYIDDYDADYGLCLRSANKEPKQIMYKKHRKIDDSTIPDESWFREYIK